MVSWNLQSRFDANTAGRNHPSSPSTASVLYRYEALAFGILNVTRYYYLFKKGELESLVERAGGCTIDNGGFDSDNWYVVVSKGGAK